MNNETKKILVVVVSFIAIIWIVNGFYLPLLSEFSKTVFWIYDFIQWVILPITILIVLAKKYNVMPREYGFNASLFDAKILLICIPVTITFYPAYFLVSDIIWNISGKTENSFGLKNLFPEGIKATVLWLYSAVTAGVIESIFFIGLPWLVWCEYKFKRKSMFVLLSAFIFSVAHWEQGLTGVVAALSYGVVACVWYLGIRNLWPIIIGHTIIDLIAFS